MPIDGALPRARVLTIAGTHSGGGAGIDADLRVFALLGLWGLTAITAVNAQNSRGLQAAHTVPARVVAAQVDAALADGGAAAGKTGQLATAATVRAVAASLRRRPLPWLVVDPVLAASSGHPLLDPAGRQALVAELFPLAALITPNLLEAELLLGASIADGQLAASRRDTARRLADLGSGAVLLKGGHGTGPAVDLLYDGQGFVEYSAPRLDQPHSGGTGCTLSAAIAGYLALGHGLTAAVGKAKELVTAAIRSGLDWGQGRGPCNAFGLLVNGVTEGRDEVVP